MLHLVTVPLCLINDIIYPGHVSDGFPLTDYYGPVNLCEFCNALLKTA